MKMNHHAFLATFAWSKSICPTDYDQDISVCGSLQCLYTCQHWPAAANILCFQHLRIYPPYPEMTACICVPTIEGCFLSLNDPNSGVPSQDTSKCRKTRSSWWQLSTKWSVGEKNRTCFALLHRLCTFLFPKKYDMTFDSNIFSE